MKGDQAIAEVRNDGLYLGERRFAIAQMSKIFRAVEAGELRLL